MIRIVTVMAGAALLTAAAAAIAAPAHAEAAPAPYERTSAMAAVVEDSRTEAAPSTGAEPRGVLGVARALAVGFKAAKAPQAAGNVARLASILGFAADAPSDSPVLEAAYFDH